MTYCPTPDGWVSTRAYATSPLLLRVFLLFSSPHLFSVSFAWRGEDRGPTFLLLFGSFGGGGGVFSRDSLTDARAAAAAGDGERAEIEIRQHTRCTNYARISKLCSGSYLFSRLALKTGVEGKRRFFYQVNQALFIYRRFRYQSQRRGKTSSFLLLSFPPLPPPVSVRYCAALLYMYAANLIFSLSLSLSLSSPVSPNLTHQGSCLFPAHPPSKNTNPVWTQCYPPYSSTLYWCAAGYFLFIY